jgi:NAD(P)-dependent dehydrogenase (short-subunit alcohol dehydrogenase family)
MSSRPVMNRFVLDGAVVLVTGGAGLLGVEHGRAVAAAGGVPVLLDLDGERAVAAAGTVAAESGAQALGLAMDVTDPGSVGTALDETLSRFGRADALVNNAANNPKVEDPESTRWSRFENFPLEQFRRDLEVGLTGAFVCAQVVGRHLAAQGKGSIVNVSSDLGLIGPDQRIYRRSGLADADQPAKPVSYTVAKAGMIGLTRYLAAYWGEAGVRVNALAPGGVAAGQPEDFVEQLTFRIPLGRMAEPDEYRAAILFLVSDASSYMTGATLVVDGGHTAW